MRRLVLIAATVGWCGTARADEWTSKDTALELAFVLPTALDWLQTSGIAQAPLHPAQPGIGGAYYTMQEMNPILGPHPSQLKVDAYFAGWLAAHFLVSRILPQPLRSIWQIGTAGIEVGFAVHNVTMGVMLRTPW